MWSITDGDAIDLSELDGLLQPDDSRLHRSYSSHNLLEHMAGQVGDS